MATTKLLKGDLGPLIADANFETLRAYVSIDQPRLTDPDTGMTRLGPFEVIRKDDTATSFEVALPDNTWVPTPHWYTLHVEYRSLSFGERMIWVSREFQMDVDKDLGDLPTELPRAITVEDYEDLVAARDEAVEARTGAETARDEAVAVATGDLVPALGALGLPQSGADLSASIAQPPRTQIEHRLAGTTEPGAFVCWTADDGYDTFEDYFALLDTKGVNGTLFLTKNWIDKPGTDPDWSDSYITTAQVQTIIANGHEIGTHGVNHESQSLYRATNGDAAYAALIQSAVTYLETTFGIEVKTGAYPYGQSDRRVREIIGRTHEFYRGTKGSVAARGQNPFDVLAVDIQALSEATIKGHVDAAVAGGDLCVFLVHGGLTPTDLAKIGNVVDYCQSLGLRMGTFYEAMRERTAIRGTAGHSVDTSGNAYFRSIRTTRFEVAREDLLADAAWFDIDETTNAPFFDSSGGNPFEFRKPLRTRGGGLFVGTRTLYGDVATTTGTNTITSATAGFTPADVGVTISGAGIPGGTTITSVTNPTTAKLSANATATAANVSVVLGRTTQPSEFSGEANFFGTLKAHHSSGVLFRAADSDTSLGGISATTWSRAGAGGTMTIDTGTGGSNLDAKAFRFRLSDHTGARRLALATAQPTDASLVNGEFGLYFDSVSGELKFRGKTDAGVVVQRTVTAT